MTAILPSLGSSNAVAFGPGAGGAGSGLAKAGPAFAALLNQAMGQADGPDAIQTAQSAQNAPAAAVAAADAVAQAVGRPLLATPSRTDTRTADDELDKLLQAAGLLGPDAEEAEGAGDTHAGLLGWFPAHSGDHTADGDAGDADPLARLMSRHGERTAAADADGKLAARADAATDRFAGDGDADALRTAKSAFDAEWRRFANAGWTEVTDQTIALKTQTAGTSTASQPNGLPSKASQPAQPIVPDDPMLRGSADLSTIVRTGMPDAVTANARTDAPSTSQAAARAATPTDQVMFQIQRALPAGGDKITIHLLPRELGRVEVTLELGDDVPIRAVVSVDRAETLDLLQRDARDLERALSDAGFDTDDQSLSFTLSDDGEAQDSDDDDLADGVLADADDDDADTTAALAVGGAWTIGHINPERVNLMI